MDLKFELNKLTDYSEESIVKEIQRVASMTPSAEVFTTKLFDQYGKVNSSTVIRKFGSWKKVLKRAGLESRFSNSEISESMKERMALRHSKSDVISELRRVSEMLELDSFTARQFSNLSDVISSDSIARKFGSWAEAMRAAGLKPTKRATRYTQEDYLENILVVWTHYRRQPTYSEMEKPPSTITPGAYEAKFGKWTNALKLFVETVADGHSNAVMSVERQPEAEEEVNIRKSIEPIEIKEMGRTISLGLRYRVLKRDNFKCVICGDSPATNILCKLHIDHIFPWSKGGKTVESNLQTLCERCNLGKGDQQ